ncbi:MAG: 4-hydroxy-tetrahydrodipicolinate synthase [Spirochaetales bacterium]|nr:4-hydroxy-tetrahydrodipicolinate synthase [Spirochaetales bacterium]
MIKRGLYTALITPFTKSGEVDEVKLRELVEEQVNAGVAGVVPCGSTGESPTLNYEEHEKVISITIDQVKGRCEVMAGTGSNSTHEAIDITRHAKQAGATCALVIVPYYNKPTQHGIYEHFKAVAEAVDLPIVIYNIKGRTGVNLETPTLVELTKIPNIIGVKEASGSIEQMMEVIHETPDNFIVFSGDDKLTMPFMAAGGDGCVSVASNVIPKRMVNFINYGLQNDFVAMREEHYKLFPMFRELFVETNPIPIKTMMSLLGKCENSLRLPLTAGSQTCVEKMKQLIEMYCT